MRPPWSKTILRGDSIGALSIFLFKLAPPHTNCPYFLCDKKIKWARVNACTNADRVAGTFERNDIRLKLGKIGYFRKWQDRHNIL
jgi:hypothetical protein